MNRSQLPVGASALLLGLLVALAGSFSDDLLGTDAIVTVLQLVLWIAGGILMLAGALSVIRLRGSGADRVERQRRTRALRPTHR
jgi:hypothetical protein